MSRVLNKYKDKIPPDAINVMRPGKWGNRFRVGSIYKGRLLKRGMQWSYTKTGFLILTKGRSC